jgi:EAL domain-containing protein (putative c-di-GMP-specific phosphodiesterase class I)
MKNPASVFRQLTDLRRHGISVAIDDFGTGHSCLGSLRNLPVNRLKLDQSFVQDVGITEQCTSIAQLVINLGRSLNLEVVAALKREQLLKH